MVIRRQLVIGLSQRIRQFSNTTDPRRNAVTTSLATCFRLSSASLSSSSSESPSPKSRMGARTQRSGRGRHRRYSDSFLCSPHCDSSSACTVYITGGDPGDGEGNGFQTDKNNRQLRGTTCGASSHLSGGGIVHHERRSHYLPLSWRRSKHCPRVRECMSTAEHLRSPATSYSLHS